MINARIKKVIEDLLPPGILRKYKDLSMNFSFKGNYSNWQEAKKLSLGYDSDIVLDKVKESMLKVKNGEYAFARDSVLFNENEYSFVILAVLLRAALVNNGELSLLDFGGALGSSYYQSRGFLGDVKKLRWNIVEQPKFVDCGKELFENSELRFYRSIEVCLKSETPHVALLSGVVQYLERPYSLLEEIMRNRLDYLIFDRTFFLRRGPDRLAIQHVPARIYSCSYPIWIFNYDNFIAKLSSGYELIVSFDCVDKAGSRFFLKGLVFKRRDK